ncbi:MAG: hypothetical protein QOG54_1348 [Actinomycetota bacterium]|jgi:signal transduction histidine kinase|nr:hypothetical protein [Actinomycetota bacterium]
MLGRQQIAGIPTAISELFKNAHDAYATQVTAHYLEAEDLFVLRDDGIGMTPDEFEKGWLTLGTESKVGGQRHPRAKGASRAILGEKGIGRLAISVIGPQVLVLSRAEQNGEGNSLVMSFINWGFFEIPGVDLEDIDLPLLRWEKNELPGADEVDRLINQLTKTLDNLRPAVSPQLNSRIRNQLESFSLNPREADLQYPGPPLSERGTGTHFYIKPTDESLRDQLSDLGSDQGSRLQRMLIGFTNTMTPNHATPPVRTHFWHQRSSDDVVDLIEEREFFTPTDFLNSDHTISGRFDEYGQFDGEVSVFGGAPVNHQVSWPPARGQMTRCGPFDIHVAYVQGRLAHSRLPADEWARMDQKLAKASGLYVYRDGIRVLPYGNNDYDFLNIELRRTKSANYYYFSYRRMFGAIEITSRANLELQEKAGREGFRENTAYKQFRQILENFFVQIAGDFFREGGAFSDDFVATRTDLESQERARRRREGLVSTRRNEFKQRLDVVLQQIAEGVPLREADEVKSGLISAIAAAESIEDPAVATERIIDAEVEARQKLTQLREGYRVVKPRGVGMGRELARDFVAYVSEYEVLKQQVFAHSELDLDLIIADSARRISPLADIRRRVERSLSETIANARAETNRLIRTSTETMSELERAVKETQRTIRLSIEKVIGGVEGRLASSDVLGMSEEQVIDLRSLLEDEVESIAQKGWDTLGRVHDRLDAARASLTFLDEDLDAAADEELLALRERTELDLELASLGMAVEVINHEFDSSLRAIRTYLRRLKSWADRNPPLQKLEEGLRDSFDHLDGYLTLFTPLQRRAQRRKIEIKGVDIYLFLKDLFRTRLHQEAIELKVSEPFRDAVIVGFPSYFYPVFVNLIDNAVFWLKDAPDPRLIVLDADGGDLLVRNTGPSIPARDYEAIFELGFTRKPGGRGMGLHLSRELLEKQGWSLFLDEKTREGVTFRLKRRSLDDE